MSIQFPHNLWQPVSLIYSNNTIKAARGQRSRASSPNEPQAAQKEMLNRKILIEWFRFFVCCLWYIQIINLAANVHSSQHDGFQFRDMYAFDSRCLTIPIRFQRPRAFTHIGYSLSALRQQNSIVDATLPTPFIGRRNPSERALHARPTFRL